MPHEMGMGAGTLGRGADLVGAARHDFDRLSTELDHEIDQLRPRWQGAGGRAFFVLKDAWHDRQRRVVAALDDLAAALRDTERDLLATDETQAVGFHHDLSRLGG
ncbi:WXG100 family type VII secretion target [Nocardioides sp. GXQ0305]|uniref:WXG100 family type VII secretion target n=1 Tax=Nocardioides sp. GXQ0305 TaxID=3423912 RepID=UPI003D7CA460